MVCLRQWYGEDERDNIGDRNTLMELDLADGAHFYEQRIKKITDYLNCDFSFGNYKVEKEYWLLKAQNVTVPFQWGGSNGASKWRVEVV